MRRKRLLWRLYASHLLVTAAVLVAVGWCATSSLGGFYRERTAADLEARARLIEPDVEYLLNEHKLLELQEFCRVRGVLSGIRITVVRRNGVVLGDSEKEPRLMENHAGRPEIRAAFSGGVGRSIRYSNTLRKDMVYVGIPVPLNGPPTAVLRTSIDLAHVTEELRSVYVKIAAIGLLAAVGAALVSFLAFRRITTPLRRLNDAAQQLARGELGTRVPLSDMEEANGMAQALNRMAEQLEKRIENLQEQRSEVEAILSSMVEGVIAVDTEERVLRVNRSASDLLGIAPEEVTDRLIQEVLPHPSLHTVASRALSSESAIEEEIVLYHPEVRYIQAHGAALRDAKGRRLGAVIVLYDVTRIRRLEAVRREFVADVSHELRTPITSIKGFVETLKDGALENRADTERFLEIVLKQAERLNAILEDLLVLARLEQTRESAVLETEKTDIRSILEKSVEMCAAKASSKRVRVRVRCGDGLVWSVNADLLEQAVVNLLDNAVKYSEEDSEVEISADRMEEELVIRVKDHGCGIDRIHLPRLFERFYRVDKARSRKLGGTGLGLAIVKHIAQVHGGTVHVESTPGEGSEFEIRIPAEG